MKKSTILITGGTGLIGTALAKYLESSGFEVIILTRDGGNGRKKRNVQFSYAEWDIKQGIIDREAIKRASAIVHLAGAGVVDKPWTETYKNEILNSRVQSSALIVKALKEIPNNIQTVISASAIGWYGPDKQGMVPFLESAPAAPGFLGETCQAWENSIGPVTSLGKRLVIFRFGIILSKEGGALREFMKPLTLRMATVIGNGRQMVSWIHIHDLCRMILFALENNSLQDVYNAVAPNPVSNEVMVKTLAAKMHGNAFVRVHVPEFALKLKLGERSIEVLKSTTVSSRKIEEAGFEFHFPRLEEALTNIVREGK